MFQLILRSEKIIRQRNLGDYSAFAVTHWSSQWSPICVFVFQTALFTSIVHISRRSIMADLDLERQQSSCVISTGNRSPINDSVPSDAQLQQHMQEPQQKEDQTALPSGSSSSQSSETRCDRLRKNKCCLAVMLILIVVSGCVFCYGIVCNTDVACLFGVIGFLFGFALVFIVSSPPLGSQTGKRCLFGRKVNIRLHPTFLTLKRELTC